jgi:hypothetical protein
MYIYIKILKMSSKIKKILKEFANQNIINRIYDMVKDDFYLVDGKVKTNIIDIDGRKIEPNSFGGINVQLSKKGGFAENVVEYLHNSFGLDYEDAEKVYSLISYSLKKENFIEGLPWVIYEDYLQYSDDPYIIDMGQYVENGKKLDIRKLENFKSFLRGWYGLKSHDAHDEVTLDFGNDLIDEDYIYIQEELIDLIKYYEGIN